MTEVAHVAVPESDGIYADVPEDVYHADRGSLSVSGAKLLLPPSCPAKFREAMDNPPKPKREYDFGHLAHRLLLGVGAEIGVLDPAVHGLKKDGMIADNPRATAAWKAAEADIRAQAATPVHIDDWRTAAAMADAVGEHPVAGPLFEEGQAETSMYHTVPGTGLRLRGRCDWITIIDGRTTVVDYKTSVTSNPAELTRICWVLGYHMQHAWYVDLLIVLGISDDPDFVFVVQEKTPPYVLSVVRYDYEALIEGRAANHRAQETYLRCRDCGVWPGYSDEAVTIGLPGWVGRETRVAADQQAAADIIAELEGIA